jgi:hypothetical protein
MTTLPTIHINGTGAETLRAEYADLYAAARRAETKLLVATCNARDFYPHEPDAHRVAYLERAEMLAKLREIMDYAAAWRDHAQAHCRKAAPGTLAGQERADG